MGEKKEKNKKIRIFIVPIIFVIILVTIILFILNSKSVKNDLSKLKYKELKEYLENNGYQFKSATFFDYDMVWCNNNKISFLATFDKETHHVKYMNYENSNLNSKNCNIWNSSKNTSEESKVLYSNYSQWLEDNKIKDTQIIDLLYNYYFETYNLNKP